MKSTLLGRGGTTGGVGLLAAAVWSEKPAVVGGSCWNVKLLVGANWSREPTGSRLNNVDVDLFPSVISRMSSSHCELLLEMLILKRGVVDSTSYVMN
ncbi:hypothetical protein F3Y22_tig00003041pilonHSYRG00552 [Hibiscus syriacus]|uniref:Uncharacterized protein n=1 Tax=Hibiscus syriacus TaxID=106335 RepID=A0A6A3CLK7_HIBSY|nr:hypothetical protein F3Y22_tig00003041pilonHSYRG00552 [Hibiscus syriacus]